MKTALFAPFSGFFSAPVAPEGKVVYDREKFTLRGRRRPCASWPSITATPTPASPSPTPPACWPASPPSSTPTAGGGGTEQIHRLAHGAQGGTELVLGYPNNMDGTRGPRAEKAAAMPDAAGGGTDLPVVLWDERRTTIDAHQILMSSGKNAKKRKKVVDAVAASLILEGYLTRKRLEAQRHE